MNGAVDKGVFVWRDCATGQWSMRVMSANTTITYQGTITSTSNFTSFKPRGLETNDVLNTSNHEADRLHVQQQGHGLRWRGLQAAGRCERVPETDGTVRRTRSSWARSRRR